VVAGNVGLFVFWCLSMFGASSGLFFGACQFSVKSESLNLQRHEKEQKKHKTLDAPNLHRHQQKQTTTNFPGTMGPLLSSCWKFWSFCFLLKVPVNAFLYISCQDHDEESAFLLGF